MIDGDTRAIFGGLVMTNFGLDEEHAEIISSHHANGRRILDVVVAPDFGKAAVETLSRKGGRCKMLANEALGNLTRQSLDDTPRIRFVRGGFLKQPNYTYVLDLADQDLQVPASMTPEDVKAMALAKEQWQRDLLLAWAVGATSNSNTITLVKDGMLIGNGVGQQDRVGACELALTRARGSGHDPKGAVAYSDSFFPFTDGPEVLIDAGVIAILATSGSIRDEKVRAVCEQRKVALFLLPDKTSRGFFGH
jgi:phosphoribosylaminoimidazolecarboxamide formyltransferase/IMP cyclohydrolase